MCFTSFYMRAVIETGEGDAARADLWCALDRRDLWQQGEEDDIIKKRR
jgi:hypothetical protein